MAIYELDGLAPTLPGDRCFVADSAAVVGDVTLGEDVSVWFGAVLRGDVGPIVVGDRSSIQDNAVVHLDKGFPTTIGTDCTIGHGCIIHGCTLGNRVLVGMGSTILSGAEIGDDCLIGANALVTGSMRVPSGSMVLGAPAKLVRPLRDDELEGIKVSANSYVGNGRRYVAALKPI